MDLLFTGSSLLAGGRSLAEVIALAPAAAVGAAVAAEFGPRLPFRLDVLAAAEPLSLRVHPSPRQARAGFAREEVDGTPVNSPHRAYRDPHAKPELVCALTEFHALCGFRDPAGTLALLDELAVPALRPCRGVLAAHPTRAGVRLLFSAIMTMSEDRYAALLDAVVSACAARLDVPEYRTAVELRERYPGDRGVLASLLLNRVTLAPGEAMFVPVGHLHAYLSGVGVQVMGSSDNVLRCGLTPEPTDVRALLSVIEFSTGPSHVLCARAGVAGELLYPAVAAEFRLSRIDMGFNGELVLQHEGPQVLLVVAGEVTVGEVGAGGARQLLRCGQSLWVPADAGAVRLCGTGTVFRATDGLATQWRLPSGRCAGVAPTLIDRSADRLS